MFKLDTNNSLYIPESQTWLSEFPKDCEKTDLFNQYFASVFNYCNKEVETERTSELSIFKYKRNALAKCFAN